MVFSIEPFLAFTTTVQCIFITMITLQRHPSLQSALSTTTLLFFSHSFFHGIFKINAL